MFEPRVGRVRISPPSRLSLHWLRGRGPTALLFRKPRVSTRTSRFQAVGFNGAIREDGFVLPYRHDIRWCCQTFRSYYEEAGRRGFGVVIEETEVGPTFLIQCRSIDPKDEQAFKVLNTPVAVSLVTQTGMLFCPWCGTNLRRRYRRHVKALSRPELSIPLR